MTCSGVVDTVCCFRVGSEYFSDICWNLWVRKLAVACTGTGSTNTAGVPEVCLWATTVVSYLLELTLP